MIVDHFQKMKFVPAFMSVLTFSPCPSHPYLKRVSFERINFYTLYKHRETA